MDKPLFAEAILDADADEMRVYEDSLDPYVGIHGNVTHFMFDYAGMQELIATLTRAKDVLGAQLLGDEKGGK